MGLATLWKERGPVHFAFARDPPKSQCRFLGPTQDLQSQIQRKAMGKERGGRTASESVTLATIRQVTSRSGMT